MPSLRPFAPLPTDSLDMTRLALLAVVALLVGCGPAQSQNDADRPARILANLRLEFPQLGQMQASVDSLRPSGIDGVDQGLLTVNGQGQPFLVTRDGTKLYLLAADAVDVSRTTEELAAAETARTEAARTASRGRAQSLKTATAGLPSRGPANAPVTIIEFSDFECPYCRLANATVEQLLQRYPNDVRLVYAHFPLDMHAWAQPAAVAATCAARQSPDAFWTLHDAYFAGQQQTTEANVMDRTPRRPRPDGHRHGRVDGLHLGPRRRGHRRGAGRARRRQRRLGHAGLLRQRPLYQRQPAHRGVRRRHRGRQERRLIAARRSTPVPA